MAKRVTLENVVSVKLGWEVQRGRIGCSLDSIGRVNLYKLKQTLAW